MARLKLDIAKLNAADLIFYCISIQNKIKGNSHFPNPTPSLTEIDAKRESLIAMDIKGQSGDRVAIKGRNAESHELKKLLRTLSLYVAMVANGDKSILLSSGFGVRREPSPTAHLFKPANLIARRSDNKGQIIVKWAPVKNAVSCQIEMTTTDPADSQTRWESVGVTSKSKFVVEDLTLGTYYWFRIKAIGRGQESPFSDHTLIMAA